MKRSVPVIVSIICLAGLVQIATGVLSANEGVACLGGYQCGGVADAGAVCGARNGPVCHCVQHIFVGTACEKDE
jgi:hypothetical protein